MKWKNLLLAALLSFNVYAGDSESFTFTDGDGNTHNVTVEYGKNGRIKQSTNEIDMADGSKVTTTTKYRGNRSITETTIEPAKSSSPDGGKKPALVFEDPKKFLELTNEAYEVAGGDYDQFK